MKDLVAIELQILTICFAYGAVRIICGEVPARLATMPVALLLSRTGDPEFISLSSENVPMALLAGCSFAAAKALNTFNLDRNSNDNYERTNKIMAEDRNGRGLHCTPFCRLKKYYRWSQFFRGKKNASLFRCH